MDKRACRLPRFFGVSCFKLRYVPLKILSLHLERLLFEPFIVQGLPNILDSQTRQRGVFIAGER